MLAVSLPFLSQFVRRACAAEDQGAGNSQIVVNVAGDIDIPGLTGTFSVDGLPSAANPGVRAVASYQSTGLSATDTSYAYGATSGGAVDVTDMAAIVASSVFGTEGGYGGLVAASFGAGGLETNGSIAQPSHTPVSDAAGAYVAFDGSAGGPVTVALGQDAGAGGSVVVSGTGSGGTADLLVPTMFGLAARSQGGNGTATSYYTGLENRQTAFWGNGGAGGSVTLATEAGSAIALTQSGTGSNAVGLYAGSKGGNPGDLLTQSGQNYVGAGGAGGSVSVTHGGGITIQAPFGIGIEAVSAGGNGTTSGTAASNAASVPGGAPGNGGSVTVEQQGTGSIALPGGGIGILALSEAGDWIRNGLTYQPSGGAVTVRVDTGATIATGSASGNTSGPFSFGVLAISSGNPLVTAKNFALPDGYSLAGNGVSGSVTLTNAGSITTHGSLAIGMAGVAMGGQTSVVSVDSGENAVGNNGSTAGAAGGAVTISNTGIVSTLGPSASGIAAISSGGGGIVENDAPAATSGGNGTAWVSGTSLGANTQSGNPVTNGSSVTVTNSGTITTGDGAGDGDGSSALVAQSIGGSGGIAGGSKGLRNVGDTGGGGGNGGDVTVSLQGASLVLTKDKISDAVLVQSIGGGGGNGANASGGFVATGGAGGAGGTGGTASLVIDSGTSTITTDGNYSAGAVVQSIGGGGGNGGIADAAGAYFSKAIGGSGGSGGAGGTTCLTLSAASPTCGTGTPLSAASVTTEGNVSPGLFAQSIGGGGGIGGGATSYAAGTLYSVSVAVGGAGGNGGAGGTVILQSGGPVTTGLRPGTLQTASFVPDTGVLFGTLGDGRGIAGANLVSGALDSGVLTAAIATLTLSDGTVLANATIRGTTISGTTATGNAVMLTLASGGILDAVSADAAANRVNGMLLPGGFDTVLPGANPNGADSPGILAQSIGGGGGSGGAAAAKSLALPLPGEKQTGVALPTVTITTAIGGSGGGGGNGGTVAVDVGQSVTTYGDGSAAVLAQSIGGGGGLGGDATASSTVVQSSSYDAQIVLGDAGKGAPGGNGGSVTATDGRVNSSILTEGQNAPGLFAQSVGGGGGAGGAGNAAASTPVLHYSTGKSYALALSLGGQGGSGGYGGPVVVRNDTRGVITTLGSGSAGIVAQSIGGGGGNAGGGVASGVGDTLNLNVAVGGSGGSGGNGGAGTGSTQGVNAENDGTVSTWGGDSSGIVSQSIGGGGGTAGSSDAEASADLTVVDDVNGTLAALQNVLNSNPADLADFQNLTLDKILSASPTALVNIMVGGGNGVGGNGETVYVTNAGGNTNGSLSPYDWTFGIVTRGERAYGMLGQSIGGGGGFAATATASSRSAPDGNGQGTQNATITLGTIGKETSSSSGITPATGNGYYVTATNYGVIATAGYGAAGVVAQSIGGGGGVGVDGSVDSDTGTRVGAQLGYNRYLPALDGGGMTVNNDPNAAILTLGRDAPGIVTQSIGGGGGIASTGNDAFATIGGGRAGSASHTVSVSGSDYEDASQYSGYNSNDGQTVTVNDSGTIMTRGDWSSGIVAQSIGGGGGLSSAYASSSVQVHLAMFVGGGNYQVVTSSGSYSKGNFAIGNGGSVYVNMPSSGAATIATGSVTVVNGQTWRSGYSAYGVLMQSIGGGGGLAEDDAASSTTTSGSVEVAGPGTGNGGIVQFSGNANITTAGDAAHALVMQSIGGSGGIGGQGSSLTPTSPGYTHAVSVAINPLTGNYSGTGGSVTLQNDTLNISTSGGSAYGILAQSIGGGGGLAFAQNATGANPTINSNNPDYPETLSDNGGTVNLNLNGSIVTAGDGASAIVAQSIGGGGGIANYGTGTGQFATSNLSSFAMQGSGGAVIVNTNANIRTSGAGADGILAQSIGGGGGLYGNGGNIAALVNGSGNYGGGVIKIVQSGSIFASGTNASGILAQSSNRDSKGGDVVVFVDGTVGGGGGPDGYGVWLIGGTSNNIIETGPGAWLTALSGRAINYSANGESDFPTVKNIGSMAGSVSDGIFINYGTYYTNGTNVSANLPANFVNVARIGLSPAYDGGPATLTQPITGNVPVLYQVDPAGSFTIETPSSYSAGTTLAGGTVGLNGATNGDPFGSGGITVINPTANLQAARGSAVQFSNGIQLTQPLTLSTADAAGSLTAGGTISGPSGLAISGPGTVILTAANSYAGATNIMGGKLVAGGPQAIPSTPLNIAAGAILDTNRFAYAFPILTGAGTVTSISSSPSLTLGNDAASYEFDGTIDQGIGALTINGGAITLTGANTYKGGTTLVGSAVAVHAGNDQIFGSGPVTVDGAYAYLYPAGTAPIAIANDFTLLQPINLSNGATDQPELTLAGRISGPSALYKDGSGIAILSGTSTYLGNTYVNQGTLRAGSTTGLDPNSTFLLASGAQLDLGGYNSSIGALSGSGTVTNSASNTAVLTVGANGSSTVYAGTIADDGAVALNKVGTGTLILAQANSFSGGTTLSGGTLAIASPNALGLGDVTSLGGVLATAGGNHLIHVAGDFTQTSGGTVRLNIGDFVSNFDRLVVDGTAHLGGTLQAVLPSGRLAPGAHGFTLPVLQFNGGLVGQFDSVQTGFPSLAGSATPAGLVVSQGNFADLAEAGYTSREAIVARYIDAHDKGAMRPVFADFVAQLNAQSPAPGTLAGTFSRLLPDRFGSFVQNSVVNNAGFLVQQFDSAMSARRSATGFAGGGGLDVSGLNGVDPRAPLTPVRLDPYAGRPGDGNNPWHAFLRGNVIFAQDSTYAGESARAATSSVVQGGLDYELTPHLLVGGLFAYSHTDEILDPAGSTASLDSYVPAIYASYAGGHWYGNALASYGANHMRETRNLAIDTLDGAAGAKPSGDQEGASLDGGYDVRLGRIIVGPDAGLQYTHYSVGGYTETGAAVASLSVAGQNAQSLRSRLGGHARYTLDAGGMALTANLQLEWQHEMLDQNVTVASQFAAVPGGVFTVQTPATGRDAAAVDLGLTLGVTRRISAFADYAALAGSRAYLGQSIQGGVSFAF